MRDMLSSYTGAAAAVVRRDFLLMTSYRFRFLTQLLSAFFGLTLFYYISRLVHVGEGISSEDDYYAYAVTGLMTLQMINSTLSIPSMTLRQELVAGTFERFAISPFGAVAGIVSMMLFPLIYTLVIVTAMLVFAGLVFGLALHWPTVPLSIPLGGLAALSFAPFGILVVAGVMLAKQATVGANWIVAGISLIGGLYFPVTLLPGWIQWMSDVQPFTPAVDSMRYVLLGMGTSESALEDVGKLLLFVVALLPVSLLALHRAVRISTRRGTIIEY
jgi:ABC-2 type transport system permease protein